MQHTQARIAGVAGQHRSVRRQSGVVDHTSSTAALEASTRWTHSRTIAPLSAVTTTLVRPRAGFAGMRAGRLRGR